MGEGDLLSMFSKEFIGVVLRPWTREEDKLFKRALVVYPKGTPVRGLRRNWRGEISSRCGSVTRPWWRITT
ncbi:MYB family transcription factor [Musa troglodytarum]|uniref:MYB family transcription factor n=1 Tax=Musa troglodytarum TaxID=320322 RepID=A0A9E7EPB7_9LILI|nr:MYB family transcription factor [Musa troglodytarum]